MAIVVNDRLQHQATLYAEEATQLSLQSDARQAQYAAVASQQAAEATRLAALRQQLEAELAQRSTDLERLKQAQVVLEGERTRTAAEHDRAVHEETTRQRELEASITNVNQTIHANRAAELAAVEAERQAQAAQLDQINALKHEFSLASNNHSHHQQELAARIAAAEASLGQAHVATQAREASTLASTHPVIYSTPVSRRFPF